MFTTSFVSVRTQIVSSLAFCALACSMVGVFAPVASAQTRSGSATLTELQTMIATLMAQIAALQGGGNTTPTLEVFVVGSQVQPTTNVRVRSLPNTNGVMLGIVTPGSVGVVNAGPIKQGGINWYRVSFKTDLSGWVAGTWLTKVTNQLIDVNSFVKTSNGTDNKMESGLEDASIVAIQVMPASIDRYANKVVLQFTPADANTEDLPWVAFKNISLWAKGWNIRNVNAGDMSLWRKVGTSYEITVFSGNQKISPNRAYNLVLAVTSDDDTQVGDRWNVTVPAKGAVIWSQTNGHMTNAAAMTTYPIEFVKSAVEENEEVSVEIIDTKATAVANTSVNSQSGEFIIKFAVTAGDNDIYLSGVPNGLDYFGRPFAEDSFVNFSIVNGEGRALDGYKLDGYTTTLTTTAEDVVSGLGTIHIIKEGETEDFTFTVQYKPTAGMAGAYRVQLEGPLRYSLDKSFNDGIPNKTADIDEKDSQTPQLYLIGGVQSVAKIDSFTVTPSTVQAGAGIPVTFTWKSAATSYCYITENLNGVRNNIGLSDLSPQGSKTYYIPDRYVKGTVVPYVLSCQEASTQKDKLVQATAKLNLVAELPFVTITDISSGAMPIISGNSEEKVSTLGFAIAGPYGDKVYASGVITASFGKWTHKVGAQLQNGTHEVVVYIENKVVARKKFTVIASTTVTLAPQKNIFNCDRSVTTKIASGSVACYGMWDYGNDFGGDVKMCGNYDGQTGCIITTPVCTSGTAQATKYIGNRSLSTANLSTISNRLGVTEAVAKAGIAGLWEYTCVGATTPGSVTSSCLSGVTKYSEGTSLQEITVHGQTTIIADASYVCRSGVWKIEGSLPVKPVYPSVPTAYGLNDILTVTKKSVNPILLAVDDEYVLYRITLKTGQVYEVKVYGNQLVTTRDGNFKKTGYTGDVNQLILLARPVPSPTTATSSAISTPSAIVKGATIDLLADIRGTLQEISKIIATIK